MTEGEDIPDDDPSLQPPSAPKKKIKGDKSTPTQISKQYTGGSKRLMSPIRLLLKRNRKCYEIKRSLKKPRKSHKNLVLTFEELTGSSSSTTESRSSKTQLSTTNKNSIQESHTQENMAERSDGVKPIEQRAEHQTTTKETASTAQTSNFPCQPSHYPEHVVDKSPSLVLHQDGEENAFVETSTEVNEDDQRVDIQNSTLKPLSQKLPNSIAQHPISSESLNEKQSLTTHVEDLSEDSLPEVILGTRTQDINNGDKSPQLMNITATQPSSTNNTFYLSCSNELVETAKNFLKKYPRNFRQRKQHIQKTVTKKASEANSINKDYLYQGQNVASSAQNIPTPTVELDQFFENLLEKYSSSASQNYIHQNSVTNEIACKGNSSGSTAKQKTNYRSYPKNTPTIQDHSLNIAEQNCHLTKDTSKDKFPEIHSEHAAHRVHEEEEPDEAFTREEYNSKESSFQNITDKTTSVVHNISNTVIPSSEYSESLQINQLSLSLENYLQGPQTQNNFFGKPTEAEEHSKNNTRVTSLSKPSFSNFENRLVHSSETFKEKRMTSALSNHPNKKQRTQTSCNGRQATSVGSSDKNGHYTKVMKNTAIPTQNCSNIESQYFQPAERLHEKQIPPASMSYLHPSTQLPSYYDKRFFGADVSVQNGVPQVRHKQCSEQNVHNFINPFIQPSEHTHELQSSLNLVNHQTQQPPTFHSYNDGRSINTGRRNYIPSPQSTRTYTPVPPVSQFYHYQNPPTQSSFGRFHQVNSNDQTAGLQVLSRNRPFTPRNSSCQTQRAGYHYGTGAENKNYFSQDPHTHRIYQSALNNSEQRARYQSVPNSGQFYAVNNYPNLPINQPCHIGAGPKDKHEYPAAEGHQYRNQQAPEIYTGRVATEIHTRPNINSKNMTEHTELSMKSFPNIPRQSSRSSEDMMADQVLLTSVNSAEIFSGEVGNKKLINQNRNRHSTYSEYKTENEIDLQGSLCISNLSSQLLEGLTKSHRSPVNMNNSEQRPLYQSVPNSGQFNAKNNYSNLPINPTYHISAGPQDTHENPAAEGHQYRNQQTPEIYTGRVTTETHNRPNINSNNITKHTNKRFPNKPRQSSRSSKDTMTEQVVSTFINSSNQELFNGEVTIKKLINQNRNRHSTYSEFETGNELDLHGSQCTSNLSSQSSQGLMKGRPLTVNGDAINKKPFTDEIMFENSPAQSETKIEVNTEMVSNADSVSVASRKNDVEALQNKFDAISKKMAAIVSDTHAMIDSVHNTFVEYANTLLEEVKKFACDQRETSSPDEAVDKNDSKWTLKYHQEAPGLVELMPGSGVLVNETELTNCKRLSRDCRTLACMLLSEVFSETALSECSLTGASRFDAASAVDTNGVNVRPGLDENARMVLLTFVEEFAIKSGWCPFDLPSVVNSLSSKIHEIQEIARYNSTLTLEG